MHKYDVYGILLWLNNDRTMVVVCYDLMRCKGELVSTSQNRDSLTCLAIAVPKIHAWYCCSLSCFVYIYSHQWVPMVYLTILFRAASVAFNSIFSSNPIPLYGCEMTAFDNYIRVERSFLCFGGSSNCLFVHVHFQMRVWSVSHSMGLVCHP